MKNAFTVVLMVLAMLVWGLAADAQTETLLLSFSSQRTGGYSTVSGVAFDSAGNLYGTTYFGGHGGCKDSTGKLTGCGVVYELSPGVNGWTETVLFNFSGKNGANPQGGVTFDSSGNLYGTTYQGGLGGCTDVNGTVIGCGVVFELSPGTNGWTEKVLHNFNDNFHDGFNPCAGVILDVSGNIYGTTCRGGTHQGGTVYEVFPKAGGGWTETILEAFGGQTHPGSLPSGTLIFDAAGNLYGTSSRGGANGSNNGTVFELSPQLGGWSETTLYNFGNHSFDGYQPQGALIFDSAGNLYGTTLNGGASGSDGTVFELSPVGGGAWNETILHSFGTLFGPDGSEPWAGLTMDASGNLYGSTVFGSNVLCKNSTIDCGTVFKLSPNGNGTWSETILYNFGTAGDGSEPWAGVILDGSGNLYGTTKQGGAGGYGTVFEIQNP